MNEKTHSNPRAKVKWSEFPEGISEICCLTNDAILKHWVVLASKKWILHVLFHSQECLNELFNASRLKVGGQMTAGSTDVFEACEFAFIIKTAKNI